jgi:branched-chain amino acid transport system substrate-binding protein
LGKTLAAKEDFQMTGTAPRLPRVSRRQALAGGLAAAALPLPFVRARAAAPIRIGFPVPLSSPYAEEAIEMVRGARVAVAMFNDQGGLHGQPAELLIRDTQLETRVAGEVTRDLIAHNHIDFVTGGLSAASQIAINEVAKQHKVLFNSVSESDAIVALPDWAPTTFHEAPTPHMMTQVVGDFAFPQYGKRVAFLAADYAFGNQLIAGLKLAGEKFGIEPVIELKHKVGTTDFTADLNKIAAAKPDMLMLCNFGPDQQYAVQQASWMGFKKTMKLIAPVLSMTARLAAGSEAYEGVIGGVSYYWKLEDSIPTANAFNRRFREMHEGRVPTAYGALGFAGPMTVLTAARHAGSTATTKLIEAMQGMKYDLYKGPEFYRACDHQAVQSLLVVESRFTVEAADRDVFNIVKTYPGSETYLASCAALGHK